MFYTPVRARSLSPTKIAESYWCLLRASCRQFFRNSSILGVDAGAAASLDPRDAPGIEWLVSAPDATPEGIENSGGGMLGFV